MFNRDMICGNVPQRIRNRTRINMDKYNMGLSDAFAEAVRTFAKEGTELWVAWECDDFRKFIPSAYIAKYLDFDKYPLTYADDQF